MTFDNPNLTTERETFVTHLECSLTGEHYDADRYINYPRRAGHFWCATISPRSPRTSRVKRWRAGRATCGPGGNCCRYVTLATSFHWAKSRRRSSSDGLLLCPEGGATLAAYRQSVRTGLVDQSETVVLFNCATGLKYPLPPVENHLDKNTSFDLTNL